MLHEFRLNNFAEILDIDSKAAGDVAQEFIRKYPNDSGLANYDSDIDGKTPPDLWLFPTKNWIAFLKTKGYHATSVGPDIFVFEKRVME